MNISEEIKRFLQSRGKKTGEGNNFKVEFKQEDILQLFELIKKMGRSVNVAKFKLKDRAACLMQTGSEAIARLSLGGVFDFDCYERLGGKLLWNVKQESNIVVDVGIQYFLDIVFAGDESSNVNLAPFKIGLIDGSNSAASVIADTDTMASHAGWTEDTNYNEGVRQTFVDARTAQSVDNSVSKAVFTMNASGTLEGSFLTSDDTKGGSSGTLLSGVAFTGGEQPYVNGNVVNVTYTFTGANAP